MVVAVFEVGAHWGMLIWDSMLYSPLKKNVTNGATIARGQSFLGSQKRWRFTLIVTAGASKAKHMNLCKCMQNAQMYANARKARICMRMHTKHMSVCKCMQNAQTYANACQTHTHLQMHAKHVNVGKCRQSTWTYANAGKTHECMRMYAKRLNVCKCTQSTRMYANARKHETTLSNLSFFFQKDEWWKS